MHDNVTASFFKMKSTLDEAPMAYKSLEDIDCCVKVSDTLEEWLYLMRNKGYRIDDSGKYLRIFPYGHSRCIRVDRRFGEEYTIDGIACRIAKNGSEKCG